MEFDKIFIYIHEMYTHTIIYIIAIKKYVLGHLPPPLGSNIQATFLIVQFLIANIRIVFGQPSFGTLIKISVPRQVLSYDVQNLTM